MAIIGRNNEVNELNELYNSGEAELVAVYGRRRVGKTFLIDKALEGKFTFRHAGLSPIETEMEKTVEKPRVNILNGRDMTLFRVIW